jgi:hypothetical protein
MSSARSDRLTVSIMMHRRLEPVSKHSFSLWERDGPHPALSQVERVLTPLCSVENMKHRMWEASPTPISPSNGCRYRPRRGLPHHVFNRATPLLVTLAVVALCWLPDSVSAQSAAANSADDDDPAAAAEKANPGEDTPANVLSPDEWQRTDVAVERALAWLVSQQQPDGSFASLPTGQPGVTSLCVMAFIAHGHVPGDGPYARQLERAAEFVLSCQKQNGLLTFVGHDGPEILRDVNGHMGTTTAYNHAISALTVSELYGMSGGERAERMERVIKKALRASLEMQRWPKDNPSDHGGWRYLDNRDESDSDLSLTGWELMFLRSARNAGFDVPKKPIDDAVAYVRRCYSEKYGTFEYWIDRTDGRTRGMAGAGILALAHAGFHKSTEAQRTGEWILAQKFEPYNQPILYSGDKLLDRYHYAVLNCCQGMYQLGGRHWEEFYPRIVRELLDHQQQGGSWPADRHKTDAKFGNAYTTALVIITLGAPNQLLPIFQR